MWPRVGGRGSVAVIKKLPSAFMIATLTAYNGEGNISHQDTKRYPDVPLFWEHIGCQQNNRQTVRVRVETDTGLVYEVSFSSWTPTRRFRADSGSC